MTCSTFSARCAALAVILCSSVHAADFRRGDSNADGSVNIADPVFTLQYLFATGREPSCSDAADANDDGTLNITDAIFLLGSLFDGGDPPPAPAEACGADPTADELECVSFAPCGDVDAPTVVISEFMAVNARTLRDGDREYSDWLELENRGDTEVDLEGFYLTDSKNELAKWQFHDGADTTLAAGERMLVFASGRDAADYVDRDGRFHTSFELNGNGEFLALVHPDGTTILDAYSSVPDQVRGASFGHIDSASVTSEFFSEGDDASALVPANAELPDGWTSVAFDDAAWTTAPSPFGFESEETGLFRGKFESDVGAALSGRSSILLRAPFALESLEGIESLRLWMRFDGGFVAYLNGVEVARAGAPDVLDGDAQASSPRGDRDAIAAFTTFDVDPALLSAGDNVLAVHGLADSQNAERYLISPVLEASVSGPADVYFLQPTPGEPNAVEYAERVVRDTEFSVDRGYYDGTIDVAVTTPTPGAIIRYTLDGSAPSASHGELYTAPLTIETTTVLRAVAVRNRALPSDVDTQTYLFLEGENGVLRQPSRPPGYPSVWAGVPSDFEMDPEIVNHPSYRDTIAADLRSLPALSVVLDRADFIEMYNNPQARGFGAEHPTSVELFDGPGGEEFQVDAGMRIQAAPDATPSTRSTPFASTSAALRSGQATPRVVCKRAVRRRRSWRVRQDCLAGRVQQHVPTLV